MADELDDDEAAKVVPLRRTDVRNQNEREAQLDEYPVRSTRSVRPCLHEMSQVDRIARTLTCRDCGAALDPIEVLDRIASQREYLVRNAHYWRTERDKLADDVKRLKREEANAKSRTRTARKNRGDEGAARAAAIAFYESRRYAAFEGLPEQMQADAIRHVRVAVEAYLNYEDPVEVETATS